MTANSEILIAVLSTLSAIVVAYFGYRQISKRFESDVHTELMKNVNQQNADLREYLSRELKETMDKNKDIVNSLEEKIQRQQEEIEFLKREKEKLQLKMFRIRLALIKYGFDFSVSEGNDDVGHGNINYEGIEEMIENVLKSIKDNTNGNAH